MSVTKWENAICTSAIFNYTSSNPCVTKYPRLSNPHHSYLEANSVGCAKGARPLWTGKQFFIHHWCFRTLQETFIWCFTLYLLLKTLLTAFSARLMRVDSCKGVNQYHSGPRFSCSLTSILVTSHVFEKWSAWIIGFHLQTVTGHLTRWSTFFESLATHYVAIVLVLLELQSSCDGNFQSLAKQYSE